MADRPVSRKKNVTDGGSGVHKRGAGLGSGPVGAGTSGSGSGSGGTRSGGRSPLIYVIAIIILLLGGGGGLTTLLGEEDAGSGYDLTQNSAYSDNNVYSDNNSSASWSGPSDQAKLDETVAPSARDKRTLIRGNGDDIVTIMVYMCGTDLESRSAMASKDLQEMLAANTGDKINLIVLTGGCKKWQNNVVSNSVNQIYQVKGGKLNCLEADMGRDPMTSPDTLSEFIRWTAGRFPADRYDLIMWDHGGGSISGYGYDEKYASAGSMTLSGIDKALKDGGIAFDFVGFDACLMATVETALVVGSYSDYLIASEETEPGIGWYYTDWLKALDLDTSMPTLEIGKNIVDSFTDTCAGKVPGQKTTLSLIDLAELEATVPADLTAFAKDTSDMIKNKEYATIARARGNTREFAVSSKIDQVDLVDFAKRVGTKEGSKLVDSLLGAVKYNRTSKNMTNAYGLSIYFPYKKTSKVDSMVSTYKAIGMDDEYAKCIQDFASLEVAGQVASGGTGSPLGAVFGDMSGSSSASSLDSAAMIGQLLTSFMGSDFSMIEGLSSANTGFLGKSLDIDGAAEYIASSHFDESALTWTENDSGDKVITLSDEQWQQVSDIELNAFYDDGEGYIDMGMDALFEFNEEGDLLSPEDKTWLSIEGQPVAYYHLDTQDDDGKYLITGRVPCMLNGIRCDLIIAFTDEKESGFVAGATYDYVDGQTDTVAKNLTELEIGDKIDFLCDHYDYNRDYDDSYYLGDTLVIDKDMSELLISNTDMGDGTALMTYCFTDLYGKQYWTPTLKY
ncbi:MAG: peptidase C11 [Lachnospiraceae bacterium]|nr:peptidase C11 [Lachnospiraceae bacterium]